MLSDQIMVQLQMHDIFILFKIDIWFSTLLIRIQWRGFGFIFKIVIHNFVALNNFKKKIKIALKKVDI